MAAAAVPAAASVDNALAGAHAGATDPIFAAIRAHDRAMAHEVACVHRDSGLDEALPEDRTTWHYDVGRPTAPEGCTDTPEWIAAQNAMRDAYRRRYDAVFALLTTPPTTLPGAVALLGYVGSFEFPGEPGAGEPMLASATLTGSWSKLPVSATFAGACSQGVSSSRETLPPVPATSRPRHAVLLPAMPCGVHARMAQAAGGVAGRRAEGSWRAGHRCRRTGRPLTLR